MQLQINHVGYEGHTPLFTVVRCFDLKSTGPVTLPAPGDFPLEGLSENLDAIIGDCFFLKAREEGSCVHFNRYGDQRYN